MSPTGHRPPLCLRPCRAALGAATLALLAACSVLPKATPQDVYLLPAAASASPAAASPLPWSLRVLRPSASPMLSGSRILVLPQDNQVNYYQGASWHEPAPALLRHRLLDALRADGRIAQLSDDDRLLQADFELDSELRAFQSEYPADHAGPPEAVIRLDVRLVRIGSQRIIASRRFEVRRPATATAVGAVVLAFGLAADELATELGRWTIEQMAAAAPRPAAR